VESETRRVGRNAPLLTSTSRALIFIIGTSISRGNSNTPLVAASCLQIGQVSPSSHWHESRPKPPAQSHLPEALQLVHITNSDDAHDGAVVAITGGGAANLFVTMQLHNVSDLDPVLHRLSAEHPGVAVLDTRVVLRSMKSWGRLLGLDGRAQDIVAVDLWGPV